jgi:hypothetical protein
MRTALTQEELNTQYTKNIIFLEKYYPDLTKKVSQCEFKQYKIVFNILDKQTKKGYFDLQNINNQSMYYGMDSYIQAQSIIDSGTKEKDFFSTKVVNDIENSMSVRIQEYVKAEEYITKYQTSEFLRDEPSKVVCFGTALGTHIEYMAFKWKNLKSIYIIEPDIELFKYSLFFINYTYIANQKQLFFSIGDDEEHRYETFKTFQHSLVSYNYSIKFIFLTKNLRQYLDHIVTEYLRSNFFELSYEHYLSINVNSYKNISLYPVIDLYRIKIDSTKPILLILSGPSLKNELEFIKKAQDKFLIVAVGSSLYPLYQNDIVADICFSMDGKKRKIEEFTEINQEYLNKVTFIASEITDPQISKFLNPIICFNKNKRTVGHYALGILCEWGFSNIYCIGNDVCISDDSKEYIEGLYFKDRLDNLSKEPITGYSYEKEMQVKGNFRDVVKSKMKFLSYVSTYESMKTTYLFSKNVYNLSDGAYIDGLTSLHSEDIDLETFEKIDKTQIIDFKTQLPSEKEIFTFNIDSDIQKIKDLIPFCQNLTIKKEFNSLLEYINHRDSTFMNTFSIASKSLHDSGGIIRFVLFFDNLAFPFLDNRSYTKEQFNIHLKIVIDLFKEGLISVLKGVLEGLEQANILKDKIHNEQKTINVYLIYKNNINNYFQTKYYLEKYSHRKINIQTIFSDKKVQDIKKNILKLEPKDNKVNQYSLFLDTDKVLKQDIYSLIDDSLKDINTDKDNKLCILNSLAEQKPTKKVLKVSLNEPENTFPILLENILKDTKTSPEYTKDSDDLILIVTYRHNFLTYYKDILSQLEKVTTKKIHFHILNTYFCEETLDDSLFTSYDLSVSLSVEHRFLFFTHLFLYTTAITYSFIEKLLQENIKTITLIDIKALILKDFSSIEEQKKDFAFVYDKKLDKVSKEVLFIRNSDISKEIIHTLVQNAKLNIYTYATDNEQENDLYLIKTAYKNDISLLDNTYCDKDFSLNSYIWIKPINQNSARFENKKILLSNSEDTKEIRLTTNKKINDRNKKVLKNKKQGIITVADIQDYNGFYEYSISLNKDTKIIFSIFMSLNDDIWMSKFMENEYYNKTILTLFAMLCKDAKHFIVDNNSYNAIFSMISHYFFKDTLIIEKDKYQWTKIKINLKTNKIPIDLLYHHDKDSIEDIINTKIKDEYKEVISILKGDFNKHFFKDILKLQSSQIEDFDIVLSIIYNLTPSEIQIFKDLGYSIFYIDEYNNKLSKTYYNNTHIWLSKNPQIEILNKLYKEQ